MNIAQVYHIDPILLPQRWSWFQFYTVMAQMYKDSKKREYSKAVQDTVGDKRRTKAREFAEMHDARARANANTSG